MQVQKKHVLWNSYSLLKICAKIHIFRQGQPIQQKNASHEYLTKAIDVEFELAIMKTYLALAKHLSLKLELT